MSSDSEEDCCITSYLSYIPEASGQSEIDTEIEKFSCPMCSYFCEDLFIMETHIEDEHLTVKSPEEQISYDDSNPFCSAVHACPLCHQTFKDTSLLESHYYTEHDVFENGLFSSDNNDEELARKLEQEEQSLMQYKERDDFKQLQLMHGFDQGRNLSRQYDANLFISVEKGKMSAVDYHEKRIMLKVSERIGLDDGSSATLDITNHIRKLMVEQTTRMCSAVDHYAASFGDSGWGCGYRNLQMLLSALLRNPHYADRLINLCPSTSPTSDNSVKVPSISRLQSAIEEAWKMGFDEQGSEQLGGKLSGTCKWIGATEIATLLASCRIRCRLIDFHRPTSADGKQHPALFDWVQKYLEETSDFKPPLYFQHQGHSRMIIGMEERTQGKARLLILDPSHRCDQMRLLANFSGSAQNKPAVTKKILVPMTALKAKQYQIVCVDGGFVDNEQEYLQSRVIRSTRIP